MIKNVGWVKSEGVHKVKSDVDKPGPQMLQRESNIGACYKLVINGTRPETLEVGYFES